MSLPETLEHIGLLVGSLVAVTGAYYSGTRNRREDAAEDRADVNALIDIKDEMIAALKEDRDALKAQLATSMKRESDLAKKVKELEDRMRENEREFNRSLTRVLEAIASSDQCLNAPSCLNRKPPSMLPATDLKVGGTG